MSTDDYLAGLNLDQLAYARDRANALIKEKTAEKKRVVWCIENEWFRNEFFPEERYIQAAERLLETAKKNEASGATVSGKTLSLKPIYVIESEYGEFESVFTPEAIMKSGD